MLFVVIYWFVDAHKWFKGPRVHPASSEMRLEQALMYTRRSTSSTRCLAGKALCWKEKGTTAATRVQAVSQRGTGNFRTRRRQILLEWWVSLGCVINWLYMIPKCATCRARICSKSRTLLHVSFFQVAVNLSPSSAVSAGRWMWGRGAEGQKCGRVLLIAGLVGVAAVRVPTEYAQSLRQYCM